MVSVYYEDLKVGQSASVENTVTEEDVQAFGKATGDMNPVHFDEEYAKTTLFRGRVAHGVLSIGFISAVLGMKLPGEGTIFVSAKVEFKAPVRIGDTVVTTGTVKEIGERRRVVMDCLCSVNGNPVVIGEALVLAPKRPISA
ncbi:MAG TPA: MaoC family dehydratase [Rhizomicrobium sp.]|jgi:3-hydroxybutyryl-CoA dehydratase|nr:MaoC family dehydratase [Rhizomicrobium sp.]